MPATAPAPAARDPCRSRPPRLGQSQSPRCRLAPAPRPALYQQGSPPCSTPVGPSSRPRRQISAISGQLNRLGPLLRCQVDLVDAALKQLRSLRSIDVHIEPGAVTPQSWIIEANSGPCECAGQYFRLALRRAGAQSEHDGQGSAPDDQGLRI